MRQVTLALILTLCLPVSARAVGKSTVDPNAGKVNAAKATPSSDLAQKVTYEAKHKTVLSILTDLSRMTGVTLKAGYNNADWQVRDRQMNIFVKDIPLGTLTDSIARVMKFQWVKHESDAGVVAFRLYMDRTTLLDAEAQSARQEQRQEAEDAKRRQKGFEQYSKLSGLSGDELAKLKMDNAFLYIMATSGAGDSIDTFFRESPAAAAALFSGQRLDLNCSSLSSAGVAALVQTVQRMKTLAQPLPSDLSNATISINTMLATSRSSSASQYLLGDVELDLDGGSVHVPFYDPENPMIKLMGEAMIFGKEQGRSRNEYIQAHRSEADAIMKSMREETGAERISEHRDDTALTTKIKLNAGSGKLPDIEKALAEASEFAVISDYFPNAYANGQIPSGEMSVKAALDKIEDTFIYNWDKHGNVIEMRDRNWFNKRAVQLPEKTLEAWRQELINTGALGIDSLAQIAQLDDEQFMANIAPDETLADCVGSCYRGRNILRLYAVLSHDQRTAMFAAGGLDLAMLSQDQMQVANELIRPKHGHQLDAGVPISMICERKSNGDKAFTYTVSAVVDGQKGGAEWSFTTPIYKPPTTDKTKAATAH